MEAEAEKLKVLQSEVEKQMSMGSLFKFSPNRSTTVSDFRGKSRRRQSFYLCWPGKFINIELEFTYSGFRSISISRMNSREHTEWI